MEDVAVENPVCAACGAEVRPDTQYCYNCGTAVSETAGGEMTVAETTEGPAKLAPAAKEILPGSMPRLETAAAMRQRPKSSQRKTVEIIWERPEDGVSSTFIIASLALLLFAVVAVSLSLYFR
jgi:hypothetical protein